MRRFFEDAFFSFLGGGAFAAPSPGGAMASERESRAAMAEFAAAVAEGAAGVGGAGTVAPAVAGVGGRGKSASMDARGCFQLAGSRAFGTETAPL